jgi:microcystin degradation protein MlrC
MMRVLIGSVCHESNTFTPFPTTKADFWTLYGDELLSDRWGFEGHPLGGITSVLRANHVELVPTLATVAMPGGVVERSVHEAFKRAILDRAHDVDGVCLFLHGAMRAQGVDYCEDDLLRDLRAQVGPDVPISIALDMHANLVAGMADSVDAMVAYHRTPHTDMFETGQKAAQMLLDTLTTGSARRSALPSSPFCFRARWRRRRWTRSSR